MKQLESGVIGVTLMEIMPTVKLFTQGNLSGKKLNEEFATKVKYRVHKINMQAEIIVIQKCDYISDDKNIKMEVLMETPFYIVPFNLATPQLIFKCIEQAENHLQNALDTIYYKGFISLDKTDFDAASAYLMKVCTDFTNGVGSELN